METAKKVYSFAAAKKIATFKFWLEDFFPARYSGSNQVYQPLVRVVFLVCGGVKRRSSRSVNDWWKKKGKKFVWKKIKLLSLQPLWKKNRGAFKERREFIERLKQGKNKSSTGKYFGEFYLERRILNDLYIQRRVWSWLRMNASGRLNTCKSSGNPEQSGLERRTGE